MKSRREHITVTLERPAEHRDWRNMARLLKRLLRGYGLKCVSIGSIQPANDGTLQNASNASRNDMSKSPFKSLNETHTDVENGNLDKITN